MNRNGALAGMIVGAVTVIIWIHGSIEIGGQPASKAIYAIMPGFLASAIATVVVSLMTAPPSQAICDKFDEMTQKLR